MRTEEKWSLSADGIPSLAMPGKARLGYNIISSEIENITAGYYDCSLPCCESDHATDNSFLSEPRPGIYRKNRTLSTTLRKRRGCTAANTHLLSQCFDWSITNYKIRTEWECDQSRSARECVAWSDLVPAPVWLVLFDCWWLDLGKLTSSGRCSMTGDCRVFMRAEKKSRDSMRL